MNPVTFLHLVLFRPRAGLTDAKRDELFAALEHALTNIPLIRRARVGRRTMLGRLYDAHNVMDFPYVATLEFDSESDLRTYLDHPAHAALGKLFYEAAESALAFDFALSDGSKVREIDLGPGAQGLGPTS